MIWNTQYDLEYHLEAGFVNFQLEWCGVVITVLSWYALEVNEDLGEAFRVCTEDVQVQAIESPVYLLSSVSTVP